MSATPPPAKDDKPWQPLGTSALGGGGVGAIVNAIVESLPDDSPIKPLLSTLNPWIATGASVAIYRGWAWFRLRNVRNEASEVLLDVEQELLNRMRDPLLSPENQQEIHDMLVDLRMDRSRSKYEHYQKLQEEIDRLSSNR